MLAQEPVAVEAASIAPAAAPSRLLAAAQRMPLWVAVVVIYAISRVFSTALMFVLYRIAASDPGHYGNGYVDAGPTGGLIGFLNVWDARFYTSIAEHGYPQQLPVDAAGAVQSNAWAFLPVFPWTNRLIAQLTGWETGTVAVLVATVFGGLAAVMLHKFLRLRVDALGALWGTTFFCFGAMGFILQTGYAESMFLFFLFAGMWALMKRRYGILTWCGVLGSFTRPGAVALALALLIVVVYRFVKHRDEFPRAERVIAVLSGLAIAAAGLAWPFIAAAFTGRGDAYLETEMSWWTDMIGYKPPFIPLTPWFLMTVHWLGILGAVVALAIVALWFWGMNKPSLRRLGLDVRAFLTSYALYLFAVFLPQWSLPRLIMPLAPVLAVDSVTHHRAIRRLMLASGMGLQITAAVTLWLTGPP
ncbi:MULTISPECIES: mannosyltransferase family protein [unclassified Frondihabitans]|uniref:mannosyltransferase family protein n=1 Tax=unclassified Frondihabitans TaxID=2626248 RepID=UPI000F50D936|nr:MULTISPECIES: mannosyltransferase family protein [unclassified Frondihabitans]RPE78008.1 mannosyltransferase PIG-V [Frondihabitans sp. PhB153]RPF08288.1 mannosyltransferase PIG-V [Frondihabitans sp. PhB161]